jgi:group I intron endonuclease
MGRPSSLMAGGFARTDNDIIMETRNTPAMLAHSGAWSNLIRRSDMNIVAQGVSGIYEIRNTINGHRYIGSAASINTRWRVHLHQLRHNKSHNAYLQKAWLTYGVDAFEFSVLCICDKSNLIMYEQRFINGLDPEYNILRVAGSALGRKISQETLQKLRLASLGHLHTEEQKAKIGASLRGKPHPKSKHKQHVMSPEEREKLRVAKLGNKWNVGKHHSQETKDKISRARKLYWSKKKAENG